MADIVITTGPLGGLGDHAIYTSLPERYAALGHDVYMDADNVCRNDEIYDLLWAKNPHVKGTSDKKPNAGYCKQGMFYELANRFPIGSIEAMERAHGLPPPYSLAPRIYYEPKPFYINLAQCVLVDFSAHSSALTVQGATEILTKMQSRFAGKTFYNISFGDGITKSAINLEGPSIRMNSIYEYVDALASCYAFVGSEAGGQSLAAAVRGEKDVYDLEARPEIVAVLFPNTFNSRGYTYRGVDYRVTAQGFTHADYFAPPEQPYEIYQIMCRRSVEDARNTWRAAKLARESLAADSAK